MRMMRCQWSTARGKPKTEIAKKPGRLFWTSGCQSANLCFSLTNPEIERFAKSVGRKHGTSESSKFKYGTNVLKTNARNHDEKGRTQQQKGYYHFETKCTRIATSSYQGCCSVPNNDSGRDDDRNNRKSALPIRCCCPPCACTGTPQDSS